MKDGVNAALAMWFAYQPSDAPKQNRAMWASDDAFHEIARYGETSMRDALWSFPVARDVTPGDWLERVRIAHSAAETGVRLRKAPQYMAWRFLAHRQAAIASRPAQFGFSQEVLELALTRLRARIGDAEATNQLLKRRIPRWRRAPASNAVGAPIIEADEVELAIVAILAETRPNWQFSSTPDGRMFTGWKPGYHREDERAYVSGLSDVIDSAAEVVETHRAGVGGRVYLERQHVECAECKQIVAWLNQEGAGMVAFRSCPEAVPKRPRGTGFRRV